MMTMTAIPQQTRSGSPEILGDEAGRPEPGKRVRVRKATPKPKAPASYALVLLINDTGYQVRSTPRLDPAAVLKSFELRKPDGALYQVSQFHYGCECTCPDFIYRRDGIDPAGCKHIKALCACRIIENAPPDSSPRPNPMGRFHRI